MPTRYREVEVKLDAPDDAAVPPLDGLDGVAAVDEPVEQQLSATYFDTEGGALAAARISLRRRTGGIRKPGRSHRDRSIPSADGRIPMGQWLFSSKISLRKSR